ncbi:sensor domain-containing diguanylate cyclase [Paucidesulfovibrio longus]|uniref:sensor domain-containing diguanylate cyclase n=1 Tax=Paucidesulfovibrio longus TaxID=889 RepID=UPI0003B667E3|nr:sensor domain-containing diguanylate cyclase [Paucidesulfovibrio longus]
MQKLSIKVRLIIALSIILLTAFMVLSVLNYQTSRKSMREEIMTSSLPLIRENIYSEIHSSLIEPILVSTTMANDAFLRAWAMRGETDVDEVTRYLRDIRTRYGFFSVFFVSAHTHRYYHYQGIHKIVSPNNAHDVWYYDFLKSGSDYQLDVDTDEVTGGILTIFINHRIEDYEGNLLGVTGVGVKMDSVARLLSDTQKKYQRRVYMVNREGLVQAHSDISLVNVFNIREAQGIRDIADQILGLRNNARNFEYEGPKGIVLLSASYVPELDWFVIVEQDEKTLLEATEGNLTRTLVGGFAATLLCILVSMLAVNHFQSRLERMTVTDELTGVANRRRFDEQFEMAKSRHQRGNNPFSLILIDLDGFKKINDKAGHLEGDRVLVEVAGLIREQIRPADLVARWGGDEFIVMAESGLKGAEDLAERIRAAVEQSQIVCPTVCHLTTSMGVAEYLEGESLDNLTSRADEALYRAKQNGRNKVETHAG